MENFDDFLKNYMKQEKINFKLYEYEQKFWNENLLVCGIDEVGRGCLAGPVVTAAAMLYPHRYHPKLIDSKLLKSASLSEMYHWLIQNCHFAVGISSARIIDRHNIYRATQMTMKSSFLHLVANIQQPPALILTDAMELHLANTPYANISRESLIKGESKSASIAAASIIAKVTRDAILQRMHSSFAHYNLKQHKGYATPEHLGMLQLYQPAIIHRKSFLKNIMNQKAPGFEHNTNLRGQDEQTSIFSS